MYDVKMEDDFDEIFHHEGIEEEVKEPRLLAPNNSLLS